MFKKLFGRKDDSTGAVDPQIVAMQKIVEASDRRVAFWYGKAKHYEDELEAIANLVTPNAAHAAKRMAKRAREALK